MSYEANIIADSLSPDDVRLTTYEITFPRPFLAEFNTHRVFSRNSASSRAIPIEKQIERIENHPWIPTYWGKNQKGMQASEELQGRDREAAIETWTRARNDAVKGAKVLLQLGVHKQTANRLLEPFMWHTVIVTATEWSNFFALRTHPDAQPEIRTIAEMMKSEYAASQPHPMNYGEWHLPLVRREDYQALDTTNEEDRFNAEIAGTYAGDWGALKKISVGRCARVSYLTHDGRRDLDADIQLHDRLKLSGHMSPFEHVARPAYFASDETGNFEDWHQYRKDIMYEDDYSNVLREMVG